MLGVKPRSTRPEGSPAAPDSETVPGLGAAPATGIAADLDAALATTGPPPGWQLAIKRGADVLASATLLALLSPLLAAIALAVKLADGGPILYRWRVVGQHGRHFVGYKFRTMVVDADRIKEQLLNKNEVSGPVFKMRHDPRVTRIGRRLRRYSMDELPQLWSVLKGDMSLVGPRPPLQTEYAQFMEWQKRKLMAKPGLTCLWQVAGRGEISDFEERILLDLEYIRKWSLWLDVKILLRTIPAVLGGRGAW